MRRDSQKRGASSRPTARCSSISTAARRITARCSLTRSSGASRFSTRSSGPTTTGAGPESAGRPSMTRSSGTSSTPPSTSSATTTSTVCPTWRRALSAPRRRRAARRRPGRRLAARRLRGADKARRHVGHTVDVVVAEDVEGGVDDVPEDRVMLGRPALSGPAPVVVGPDDLVEKRLAPEDLVKEHLAVMRLAAVDMEEQRAVGREDAPRFCESRRQEPQVVREIVRPGGAPEDLRAVAPPLEAGPVAVFITRGAQACALLRASRVERRVDVDEARAGVRQLAQHLEVVAEDDALHRGYS